MYNISYFPLFLCPTVKRAMAKGKWAAVGSKLDKMGWGYADAFGGEKQRELGDITHLDSVDAQNVLML